MTNKPLVVLSPHFLDALKRLKKKYRHARADLQPLLDQLERGESPGDQISGIGYPVYKVRLRSTDIARGKSGGYRVIYYVRTVQMVVLLTMYAKAEQVDITSAEIRHIISDWESST